ncbi:hypothetical protein [Streptomyces phaeofaciens]|uniref:hypothetical protein n=1 Tax=Streptomyces phaeofaciens TaxID=68254 RepID=UPI0036CDE6D5
MRAEILRRWRAVRRSPEPVDLRVALLGSFTVDTLVPCLGNALADRGTKAEIHAGPFHRIAQECADPASATAAFGPDVLVVWPRLEDVWGNLPAPVGASESTYLEPLQDVLDLAAEGARTMGATLVLVLPAVPDLRVLGVGDAADPHGTYATATAVRERVRSRFAGRPGIALLDAEEAVRKLGADRATDRRLGALAGIPYSVALLEAVGDGLARAIGLATRPARTAVVVSPDNTLWGGSAAGDSVDAPALGTGEASAHLDFQSYLQDLRRTGVSLAVSGRDDDAVCAAFSHREMRLSLGELSARRAGRDPQPQALREIARELGVGTDAIVFVTADPEEAAEVRAELPETATVVLPADPTGWPAAVEQAGALDRLPAAPHDRGLPGRTVGDTGERPAEQSVPPETYLQELGLWARARTALPADLDRLTGLVGTTHAMTINGLRPTVSELRDLCADRGHRVRLIDAGDRFGDSGTVGAYLLARRDHGAELRMFLLGGRSLGRGIERFMLADAQSEARRWGHGPLFTTVVPTSQNEPARRLFAKLADGPAGALRPVRSPRFVTVKEEVTR